MVVETPAPDHETVQVDHPSTGPDGVAPDVGADGDHDGRRGGDVQLPAPQSPDVLESVMNHLRAINWNNGIRPRSVKS